MADAARKSTSNAGKKKGYRVRLVMFVPVDPKNLTSTKDAITFAEKFQTVPEGAPEGTVIEQFSATHGFEKEDE